MSASFYFSVEDEKNKRVKRGGHPNVLQIDSLKGIYKQDFVDESSKITVVRFYLRYCKSCQTSEPCL